MYVVEVGWYCGWCGLVLVVWLGEGRVGVVCVGRVGGWGELGGGGRGGGVGFWYCGGAGGVGV